MSIDQVLWSEAERICAMRMPGSARRDPGRIFMGLIGELEFAQRFKLPCQINPRPATDGGVDFIMPYRQTVDVKTADKPKYLICERGRVVADIYVLAQYFDDPPRATLLGWERGSRLCKAPVQDFGYGIMNHYIAREALRPIDVLLDRLMRMV